MNNSLDSIFRPKSIAVVGASAKPGSIGNVIIKNLINNNYSGKIIPVNLKADEIESLKCYPTITDIPDDVEMAIIIAPRDFVKPTLEQCGKKGVKGLVVITSGFKEIGEEGAKLELELVDVVKKYNMRMIGPNCFGILNTDPKYSINATFTKNPLLGGPIAFVSQSGALGEAVLDYTRTLQIGFSMFASVGNKADVSDNDTMLYLKDDPGTELILLYLENIDDPARFAEIANSIVRDKPIVAVKAGRTEAGAKAIGSHTGALAGSDSAAEALFDKCGVIRVTTVDELFDVATAFTNQPLPKGDNVAVITNAGGPGILATDAVIGEGMKMAEFDKNTIKFLREKLPPIAAVNNPIDVVAAGGPESYAAAVEAVLKDDNVDAVIVIFVPPILVDSRAVMTAIIDSAKKYNKKNKTIVSCLLGSPEDMDGFELMRENKIPNYLFPESAAKSLAALIKYRDWVSRPQGEITKFDVDKKKVASIIEKPDQKTILGTDAFEILKAYGIGVAESVSVSNEADLKTEAERIGYPLVMKTDDPEVSHKTDMGGVVTDIKNSDDLIEIYKQMSKKFDCGDVLIQKMLTGGVETIIGMHRDPNFGPMLMFGLGGIFVELMKDVSFRLHPVTDFDVDSMIKSLKSSKLLTGFRGSKPVNIDLLKETILRLSLLIGDFPEIDSLDINPFIISENIENSKAVDIRILLQ